MGDGQDDDGRIRALEKGQLELRENIHEIRGHLQVMQSESRAVSTKLDRFLEAQDVATQERQKEARAKSITPLQIAGIVGSALGASTTLLAGLVWLIHSFTDPVQANIRSAIDPVAASINNLASQTADRFNVFQESIRSIREGDERTGSEIGNVRVALGRIEDRDAIMEKRWEAWDRADWPGINATQTAEIAANRARLDRVEAKQEDRIRRELENLAKDRDREIDRQEHAR